MLTLDFKNQLNAIASRLRKVLPSLSRNNEVYNLAKELTYTAEALANYLSKGGGLDEGNNRDITELSNMVLVLQEGLKNVENTITIHKGQIAKQKEDLSLESKLDDTAILKTINTVKNVVSNNSTKTNALTLRVTSLSNKVTISEGKIRDLEDRLKTLESTTSED